MKTRYLEIDERTELLKQRIQSPDERARQFQGRFDMSLIYHENALEGVVFTSTEIIAALDPLALPADAAQVPVFAEIRNHKAAIDFIRAEARDPKARLTVDMMKRLFEILGAGLEGREVATFRKEMPLHRTYFHDIAQPTRIPALLDELVALTATPEFRELHPVEQAATVQWHFMQVFPFTENSGKVGRLLTQFLLIRDGYLPVIVHASDRQRYYESLRLPVAGLRGLVLEAMENSLENALKFFGTPPVIPVRPPPAVLTPTVVPNAKPAAKQAAQGKAAPGATKKPSTAPAAARDPVDKKAHAAGAKSAPPQKPAAAGKKPSAAAKKPAASAKKPAAAAKKPAAAAKNPKAAPKARAATKPDAKPPAKPAHRAPAAPTRKAAKAPATSAASRPAKPKAPAKPARASASSRPAHGPQPARRAHA